MTKQFLVRRVSDGTMRTFTMNSANATPAGAMRSFAVTYAAPPGEEFAVKERGVGDWEYFRVNRNGIRRLS